MASLYGDEGERTQGPFSRMRRPTATACGLLAHEGSARATRWADAQLARERGACTGACRRLSVDDLQARRLAKDLGLAMVGTAGVLFTAKQRGFSALRPPLDALRAAGFQEDVYEEILKAAGESQTEA